MLNEMPLAGAFNLPVPMRSIILLAFLLSLLGLGAPAATAQIDTTGGKFYRPLYATTVTRGVAFGAASNVYGVTQTLLMDVYQPVSGPAGPRPVLLLAHGGGFVFGTRADQDVSELCLRFARLGYVTASIDYRLTNTAPDANALVRAMHDMRAAVRFFRQDAATANVYQAAPDYLFVGGSSAGAFTALNTAFLDTPAELAAVGSTEAGGVEGGSGNPGYASTTRACVNLCGALGQPAFITAGSEPFVSLHGTSDTTVPYYSGTTPFNPTQVVYGSGSLKVQATAVGVVNALRPFSHAGHVPYAGTSASAVAYMDTTYRFVRGFLRAELGSAGALPVTLTRFDAVRQGAGALLSWATASEASCRGFEVQVSADGATFHPVGFVPAAAPSSSAPHSYRFEDTPPLGRSVTLYYRLRQVDLDGTAAYYGPRTVAFGAAPPAFAAYPNPFGDGLAVDVPALAHAARLALHDAQGRPVLSQPLAAGAGATRQSVALPASLPAGWYVLSLTGDGPPQRLRLLKR